MATNLPVERASSGDLHARADWSKRRNMNANIRKQKQSRDDSFNRKGERGEPDEHSSM